MKIALIFIAIIALLVVGLPFSLRHENAISDAVQTFLAFSLGSLGFILSVLTIFLSRSLSDELVNRQILILMAKPIPRWQFVVGKWLGIVTLNLSLLVLTGVSIYVATSLMARLEPRDEIDKERLFNEVLTARHSTACKLPDFAHLARQVYEDRWDTGVYAEVIDLVPTLEKERLAKELETQWRTVLPLDTRVFEFQNVRCERSPDTLLQIRYRAEVWAYSPDEILRVEWIVGNPDKGTPLYYLARRDVIGRFHSMSVPTDAVAPDRTLTVVLRNRNPFEGEKQQLNTMSFTESDDIQVLFAVGTFGGNLVRQLTLLLCKLMFLAAFALLTTCIFSFPVACLVSFVFLAMTSIAGFLTDAIFFLEDEGVPGLFRDVVRIVYQVIYFLIPRFSQYDGTSLLVDGRNVTLRWVLSGIVKLVLGGTTSIMLVACLLFHRREVAEVSV